MDPGNHGIYIYHCKYTNMVAFPKKSTEKCMGFSFYTVPFNEERWSSIFMDHEDLHFMSNTLRVGSLSFQRIRTEECRHHEE